MPLLPKRKSKKDGDDVTRSIGALAQASVQALGSPVPLQHDTSQHDRRQHEDSQHDISQHDLSQLDGSQHDTSQSDRSQYDTGQHEQIHYDINLGATNNKTQVDKENCHGISQHDKIQPKPKAAAKALSGLVTITLLEGKNLLSMDTNGFSDPYVKFKLGNQKYKSRVKCKTLNPRWMEEFDLHFQDGLAANLNIFVRDKDIGRDDHLGSASIDLSSLKHEVTHNLDVELKDGAGVISLLLTISGMEGGRRGTVEDITRSIEHAESLRKQKRKYNLIHSLQDIKDTGWLQVKVIKAQNLVAGDIGGKSDPFCILELVNTRLVTQTVYKTLDPEWDKEFSFNVKDIHSVLEVTVLDENKYGDPDFLGKIAIPLLKIRSGERRYYTLKDKKLKRRSRGMILLEFSLIWNDIRAVARTFKPREEKYMAQDQKFKLSTFQTNIGRVKELVTGMVESGGFINSCFQWESPTRSAIAFLVFLVSVWKFEFYMVPLAVVFVFMWKKIELYYTKRFTGPAEEEEYADSDEEDDEKDEEKGGTKNSLAKRLHKIEKICQTIQNALDEVACTGERVKNLFNFSVPWLSCLAILILCIFTCILYLVPIRLLILVWGTKMFTKKLRGATHAKPFHELLNFLSRLPSDKILRECSELRPEVVNCNRQRPDSAKKDR